MTDNPPQKVNFGVWQGLKFALGFWIGTAVPTFIVAVVFGSVISVAASSLVQHSIQSAFAR